MSNGKAVFVATISAMERPLAVFVGFLLGVGSYPLAIAITLVLVVFEFVTVIYWMKAQTDDVLAMLPGKKKISPKRRGLIIKPPEPIPPPKRLSPDPELQSSDVFTMSWIYKTEK